MKCKRPLSALIILFMPLLIWSQDKIPITGVVKNNLGQPIEGVSVLVQATNVGTATAKDGSYQISANNIEDSLSFSAVGFIEKKVSIRVGNRIDVNLDPIEGSMEAIAVVGFGKQKKISLVGSQSTVDPEELRLPVRDLTNALAGRLAGVVAVQRSGEPGSDGSQLFIRGIATFSSSPRAPLVVIDGVPDRPINNINPEDIQSFTVLKDASATAVYGTRGANGVILVVTKQGRSGKPQISVELNQAVTRFTRLPDFVDAPTYMRTWNEALQTRNRPIQFSEETIQKHISGEDPDLYPNVNWFDELFNKYGSNNRVNVNIRGGGETSNYYVSAGYFGEVGLFKREDIQSYNNQINFKRFNFLTNVSVNVTKSTKFDIGING